MPSVMLVSLIPGSAAQQRPEIASVVIAAICLRKFIERLHPNSIFSDSNSEGSSKNKGQLTLVIAQLPVAVDAKKSA
jgi:hypothetical protein